MCKVRSTFLPWVSCLGDGCYVKKHIASLKTCHLGGNYVVGSLLKIMCKLCGIIQKSYNRMLCLFHTFSHSAQKRIFFQIKHYFLPQIFKISTLDFSQTKNMQFEIIKMMGQCWVEILAFLEIKELFWANTNHFRAFFKISSFLQQKFPKSMQNYANNSDVLSPSWSPFEPNRGLALVDVPAEPRDGAAVERVAVQSHLALRRVLRNAPCGGQVGGNFNPPLMFPCKTLAWSFGLSTNMGSTIGIRSKFLARHLGSSAEFT